MWVNPKWIIKSPKVPLVLLTADEREKHIILPCWYGVVSHTVLETRRRAFKHLCSHMVGEQDHTYTLVSVCVEHVCSYVHHQVCNCKISLLALLCWFISLFRGVLSLELPKGLGYFLLSSAMASGRSVLHGYTGGWSGGWSGDLLIVWWNAEVLSPAL